jgi:hypothetical protein
MRGRERPALEPAATETPRLTIKGVRKGHFLTGSHALNFARGDPVPAIGKKNCTESGIFGVTCDPSRVTAILIPAPRYIPRKVTLIHGRRRSHREPRFGSVHLNVKSIQMNIEYIQKFTLLRDLEAEIVTRMVRIGIAPHPPVIWRSSFFEIYV